MLVIDKSIFNTLEDFDNKCKKCSSEDVTIVSYNENLNGLRVYCNNCKKYLSLGKRKNNKKKTY